MGIGEYLANAIINGTPVAVAVGDEVVHGEIGYDVDAELFKVEGFVASTGQQGVLMFSLDRAELVQTDDGRYVEVRP